MSKQQDNIEIRSEEIQDILGQVPSWIVRWGTVIVLATVLLLLAGSLIFQYPDIVRADVIVTTENPPVTMIARTDGQIANLFADDSQYVEFNQPLVVIESAAEFSDVISLQFDMEGIRTTLPGLGEGEPLDLQGNYTLGEIQTAYAEFVNKYENYFRFLEIDYHNRTIESKREEIRQYRIYASQLERQRDLLRQEVALVARQYTRDSTVFQEGAISEAALDQSLGAKIAKERELEQARTELSQINIQIAQLEQEIQQLELTAQDLRQQKKAGVREAFERLVAAVDEWEQTYLLKAEIDGVVDFSQIYSENQFVRRGERVLTIIPVDPGEIIGKIDLPAQGAGKVERNQKVNIQFANFPHLQYGMVPGEIRNISQVPEDQRYTVEVAFPEGLVTHYDYEIPFTQEMPGRAEIRTDDRTLFQRITSPIRSLFREQQELRKTDG